jgi:hypothetical protein
MNQLVEGRFLRPGITPEAEYSEFGRCFRDAWEGHPGIRHERWFTLADQPVRIRVVGDGLAEDVYRAFSHLRREASGEDPSLRIDLWDGRASGIDLEGVEAGDDLNVPGEMFVSANGRVVVYGRTQARTAFDRVGGHILGWIGRHDHLTQYEIGRPLHSELLLWHKDRDVQAIHAGLVSRNGDGVLFGGPGGSGKSTTALTCLKAGWEYLADDYVGLKAMPDGSFLGYSLYCSTHLEPKHFKRFPYLEPHAIPGYLPREDKTLVLLSEVLPGGLSGKTRIRAVALPIVTKAARPTLRPATKVESLLRLAPSSLLMLPHGGIAPQEFEKLSVFLQSVPTYWLELGENMEEIPLRVGELLDRHS